MSKQLREKIVELLYDEYGGDSDFDKEGGFTPCRDHAEEVADQIIQAIKEGSYDL